MSDYLTFPIVILKDSIKNIKQAANNAMFYCLYDYCKDKQGTQTNLIKEAEKHFEIVYSNKKEAYDTGKILYDCVPDKCPKTSIRKDTIFDFYKNNKTEFEVITFLAFAALRSILQRQPYTKITNEYLIGRMAGNSTAGEPLPNDLFKYNNRYQLDKIKLELQLSWGLKLYSYKNRGYYVSFSLEIFQLIKCAELKRKSRKEKELKQKKDDARKAVLVAINAATY